MADQTYRKINSLDLRPVYTSLGIARPSFKEASRRRSRIFDAALNTAPGSDLVWLFKDAKYYRYNLAKKEFETDAQAIAGNWGGSTWPALFSSGIDAAAWGGPKFPHYWYMFKENRYIRLNSEQGGSWVVEIPPRPLGKWADAEGTWFADGCDVALAGQSAQDNGMTHLFRGAQYMRRSSYDVKIKRLGKANGTPTPPPPDPNIGPVPIREQFGLPEPFADKIDLAFYDQGDLVFFSGDMCADFDLRRNEVLEIQPIERRFPAFARFLSRPQIFLVENYSLETFAAPAVRGRLVDTRHVERGTTLKLKIVTETVSESRTSVHDSILESQSDEVMHDFNDRLDNETKKSAESENYAYQMNADFHGDASATSVWGGEINAQLAVSGGTDTNRDKFAEAAFKSVASQVRTASESIKQRTYTQDQQVENLERVISQQELEIVGPPDRTRVTEFYQRLEPYLGLLVLKNVQVAYGDGSGTGLIPQSLSSLQDLLEEKLVREEDRSSLIGYLNSELTSVSDVGGRATSVLTNPGTFELTRNSTSTYEVQHPDGQSESIVVRGLLIKAASEWTSPTTQVLPVDVQ